MVVGNPFKKYAAIRIVLVYAFTSACWILVSDYFLEKIVSNELLLTQLQTLKGWFFVLATSGILYGLLQTNQRSQHKSYTLLQKVVEGTTDAIFVKDRRGRYIMVNSVTASILGQPVDAILNREDTALMPAEMAQQIQKADQEIMARGEPVSLEEQVLQGSQIRTFWSTKYVWRNSQGHVQGLIGIARDLTEYKQLQEERQQLIANLQAQAEDLQALHLITANAVSTLNLEELLSVLLDRLMSVTQADAAMILLSQNHSLYVRASRGLSESEITLYNSIVGEGFAGTVFQTGKPLYVEDASQDLRFRAASPMPRLTHTLLGVPLQRGTQRIGVLQLEWQNIQPYQERILHLLEIIGERCTLAILNAQLFEQTQALKERLQLQIDRMPVGCIIHDQEFRFVDWNQAAESIFGYTKAEVLGQHPFSRIVPPSAQSQVSQIFQRVVQGDMTAHCFNENQTCTGRLILCSWHNTPLLDAEGNFVGLLSMVQDVTEQKQAEEQLKRLAYFDPLTSLPRRSLFLQRLEELIEAQRNDSRRSLAVLYLDIERFKFIKYSLGHHIAEALLIAIAIERLVNAGAKVVAFDVLFTTNSAYGPSDDQQFAQILNQYGDRVVLGSTFSSTDLNQGDLSRPNLPIPILLNTPATTGLVQFPIEIDGRIHRQGSQYISDLAKSNADIDSTSTIDSEIDSVKSFAESVLAVAEIDYPAPPGPYINYSGPHRTFEHIPFWYVLDSDPWTNYLQSGTVFKDKIVIIGATAGSLQDFWAAPFSQTFFYPKPLSGVEILANDIATLQAGTALREGLPQPWMRGLLILATGCGYGLLLRQLKRPTARLALTVSSAGLWLGLGFVVFSQAGVVLPTATPIIAFLTMGGAYLITNVVTEQISKQRLRKTLAFYATSPIVQEIISQQEDFHDLLKAREEEVIGLLLQDRYQVIKLLGSGGFGETYVAQDTQRPGSPTCVVKQLKIISDDPKAHILARRLFTAEAETLEQLGHHDQIPRLLASFEAHYSFYLVEEMIEGRLLRDELASRTPKSQLYVLSLLKDILPVVTFVHSQNVIHRDIKPSNLIRRKSDKRLVLIDFGAVKQISNKLTDTYAQVTSTIGIGTQGYMPSEQSAGMPKLNSDLYAIGITAIEALTGLPPYALQRDKFGEVIWKHAVSTLNSEFANILTQLVRYDFTERYQSSEEVLADLLAVEQQLQNEASAEELEAFNNPSEDIADLYTKPEESEIEESEIIDSSTCVLPDGWNVEEEVDETVKLES
ncbi:PAS domain-containing protein [Pseudanabaena sp. FACHB-2040]|uniref:PAS domain-containing protein n=1 Tax=Pseudanabaena sp. FACHB-2040 TaxID=2692859 RepID=UPI0016885808|nr:PAS domain-containing protein [Pseudanabaena sp. FACHB-2040]MBD2260356.1 PAS domain-containing protein [Pseudanabaena sp. FACHB-2040]